MNNRLTGYLSLVLMLAGIFLTVSSRAGEDHRAAGAKTHHGDRQITVYHDPSCGCCSKWIDHLEQNRFHVTDRPVSDLVSIKRNYGVPRHMASCHTAVIDGYIIEGHVPADDIERLLRERPDSAGLAVPGMPVGTPGMEMGQRRDAFAVYEFESGGEARVYHSYPGR